MSRDVILLPADCRAVLHIGGPLDGQRIVVKNELHYVRVIVADGRPESFPGIFHESSYSVHTYRRESLGGGRNIRDVFVFEGISIEDGIDLLVDNYRPDLRR